VNPRANEADGSPYFQGSSAEYLRSQHSRGHKRSLRLASRAFRTPLFARCNTVMLFGGGKQSMQEIVAGYKESR
jgi:NAD/NADP transhydrogenase beta subunit